MRILSKDQVHALKVTELGLDKDLVDLTFVESIAAALRRAAGFLCPCSATSLIRAVLRPLEGIVADVDSVREAVEETLEALIAHGDLQEHCDVSAEPAAQPGRLLYAAPPSFVMRESGVALILGISPDHLSPLPDELARQIEYQFHVRRLKSTTAEDLRQMGFVELPSETWLREPAPETPAEHLSRVGVLLDAAPVAVDIPGLTLLDPARPVRYYPKRWTEPRAHSGRFVGRRPQPYGADLWCYVELTEGRPCRFIDLPLSGSRQRGCDEAWRLQAAIDADRGEPQRFRSRNGPSGRVVIDFFSPVPMWARRRWNAIGEPAAPAGCLFSYSFPTREIEEEQAFARERLWLAELVGGAWR